MLGPEPQYQYAGVEVVGVRPPEANPSMWGWEGLVLGPRNQPVVLGAEGDTGEPQDLILVPGDSLPHLSGWQAKG